MDIWEEFNLSRNPFEIKPVEFHGIIPLDTFQGREKEFQSLKKNIRAGNTTINLIIGEKGIGKTSLANKTKYELNQEYFVPIEEIDCQSSWSSREFIHNLLTELYLLKRKAEQYDEINEKYLDTAAQIHENLKEVFLDESSQEGGGAGAFGFSLNYSTGGSENLKNIPISLMQAKLSEVADIVIENGYEGILFHYNNLDNLEENVENFSNTLSDLRDFLITDYCHFIFCGDERMENAFSRDEKVNECVTSSQHLTPMDDQKIWNIIQKRCSLFEIDGRKHMLPVNAEAVKFLTDLHDGNIRKVFSALKSALLNMEELQEDDEELTSRDVHQLNESEIKEILRSTAESEITEDVSPRALEILKYMVGENSLVNNKELEREYELDASTISQYTTQLSDSNLITVASREGSTKYWKENDKAVWLTINPENHTEPPVMSYFD